LFVEVDGFDLNTSGVLFGHGDFIAPCQCAKEFFTSGLTPDIGKVYVDNAFGAHVSLSV
jgi:hypothetical protein